MMNEIKPNFFLVGAAKAGTTSLYNYLSEHPDIYFSPLKEPNYFSTDIKPEAFSATYRKNTFLDVEQYFSHSHLPHLQLSFVRKPEYYHRLFENVSHQKAIGEASTSYLYSQEAASNIRNYQPDARILAIIRNPVDRIISHYQMALRYGHIHKSFREAVEEDINNPHKGWGISELFIELGMYYEQLKRYYDTFGQRKVKVLLFDDLVNEPERTIKTCHRFLGVAEQPPARFGQHNPARIPRYRYLNKFMTDSGLKNLLKYVLPSALQEKLKTNMFDDGDKVHIPQQDIDFLRKIYKTDIHQTSQLIDRDLTHWLIN